MYCSNVYYCQQTYDYDLINQLLIEQNIILIEINLDLSKRIEVINQKCIECNINCFIKYDVKVYYKYPLIILFNSYKTKRTV